MRNRLAMAQSIPSSKMPAHEACTPDRPGAFAALLPRLREEDEEGGDAVGEAVAVREGRGRHQQASRLGRDRAAGQAARAEADRGGRTAAQGAAPAPEG